MKKLFIIAIIMLLSAISLFSQACEWAERIGGKYLTSTYSIVTNKIGNIFVSGCFDSPITFNNGISLFTGNISHF